MEATIPTDLAAILLQFSGAFSSPAFRHFTTFITGAILCTGRHTISRIFQAGGGPGRRQHHAAFYRFLSRAQWNLDRLGQILFGLLRPFLPEEILAATDDTLSHKSGPHLFGGGMHHDATRSTYGRGTKAGPKVFFAFGHNWVALSIWVPLPWNPQRGVAIPILFRLYRSKKLCPPAEYRKRTELASELVEILAHWVGPRQKLLLVGDHEYACHTLVRSLPPWVNFIGPMPMDAAVYAPAGLYSGRGRYPKKGPRRPSPKQLADDPKIPWATITVPIYGHEEVTMRVKTQRCLWYRVAGTREGRLIVTQDPSGRLENRAYFSTDPDRAVEDLVVAFSRRWPLESAFRDAKQLMGVEDPQNGWWRRRQGLGPSEKRPGPQPKGRQGQKAVERTFPLLFLAYAIVIVLYLHHGKPAQDVKTVRQEAPWYRHKVNPSFADMLAAARREIWAARFSRNPLLQAVARKIVRALPHWLLAS